MLTQTLGILLTKCKNLLFFSVVFFFFIVVIQLLSCAQLFVTQWTRHTRLPCPSLSPRVCSNTRPWVNGITQPFHPLLPPFPLALNLSQYQDFFQWVDSSSHQVAKVFGASASVLFSEVSKHEQIHRFWYLAADFSFFWVLFWIWYILYFQS